MGVKVEVKMEVKMDKCIVYKRIVHFNSLFNSQLSLHLIF